MSAPTPLRRPRARAARLRSWLAGDRGLALLALLVGVGAGLGAIAFRWLVLGITHLFTGVDEYGAAGRVANPHLPGLGPWFLLLAPVVGGLVYGPLVARFAPEARGHGVPEVMLAVAERGGRIRPSVPAVKALASALTIGSGGSVGREGPIVQIGSALGSVLGQAARVPAERLRLLVACGAAGGIAATFNAPIAGVFFALEVILGAFETRAFGLVVLSSVVASTIARGVLGSERFLTLPAFALRSPVELLLYAALGALAGVVGIAFVRVLYGAEDLADAIWRGPQWARPAAGGLLLGLLLLAVPQMYGVGYPVLTDAVAGRDALGFLVLLLAAKVVATSLTIAIGGSGGVFAPSLFLGAMAGAAVGQVVHAVLPGLTAPAGAYALVGMGAVFAGSARAPITAVLIVFELTGEYAIVLPLMLAVVVATAVSARLSPDTIYTLKLRRRGITVDRPRVVSVMRSVPVAAAMGPVPASLPATASVAAVRERLERAGGAGVPVADEEGQLLGLVRPDDVEADPGATSAGALARSTATLRADDELEAAAKALGDDETGLPVLAADGDAVVGWVTHRGVLAAYARERARLGGGEEPPPVVATSRPTASSSG